MATSENNDTRPLLAGNENNQSQTLTGKLLKCNVNSKFSIQLGLAVGLYTVVLNLKELDEEPIFNEATFRIIVYLYPYFDF